MDPSAFVIREHSSSEQPAEQFELVYEGPDVDDGTMTALDLAEVLTGLTRAFSAIADESGAADQYQLRITDLQSNSIHLLFEAIEFAKRYPGSATAIVAGSAVALNAITNTMSGAHRVILDIAKLIDAKKRLKGARPATVSALFTEAGVVLESGGDDIVLTKGQYELLLSRRIDRSILQIVAPLAPKRIDKFQIRRASNDLVIVDANEKGFFDVWDSVGEERRDGTEIQGTFNSLSKTNLRGTFYTIDGVHVPYRYAGGDIEALLRGFAAREPLRVRGRITYGSDGIPTFIEAEEIEFLQDRFFEAR